MELWKDFWVRWSEWFDLDEPLEEPVNDGNVDDPSPLDMELTVMVTAMIKMLCRLFEMLYKGIRE